MGERAEIFDIWHALMNLYMDYSDYGIRPSIKDPFGVQRHIIIIRKTIGLTE